MYYSEKIQQIIEIRDNVNEAIRELITQMTELNISFKNPENILKARQIMNINKQLEFEIEENLDYAMNVRSIWKDLGIQECYKRANEFQLIDCAK